MSYAFFPGIVGRPSRSSTPIVLLHGFVSSRNYWKRVIPFLTQQGYPVIAIDLLGFGSARHLPTREYTYDSHINHIEKCLENAGVTSRCILVGHSMGALLAAHYANTHRSNIAKLILLHPPFYIDQEQAFETLHATSRLYRFLLTSRFRRLGWGLLKFLPTGIANHSRLGREESLENVILSEHSSSILASPPISTLLVIGVRDRKIYQENLQCIQTSPLMEVRVINSGHHSPLSNPRFVSELIQTFVGTETT